MRRPRLASIAKPTLAALGALAALALALAPTACAKRAVAPPAAPRDARGGHAPPRFDAARACGSWAKSVGPGGEAALEHDSFPELDAHACFVPVTHARGSATAGPLPDGCGYPAASEGAPRDRVIEAIRREIERYQRIAEGATDDLPTELACPLAASDRVAAARTNARSLAGVIRRAGAGRRFPYAAASTFGFGHRDHERSPIVAWRPGDACPRSPEPDVNLFGVNVVRAGRAAEAFFGGVAPVITVSGGAVHSKLNESFLLDYILTCRLGVRPDAVLLDPCADHTHTNVRNTGRLVRALAGRTAYVLTDDGLQAGYLQEWTVFDLIGGSIDQRALRDWGYLVGSWRQASTGIDAGFWFTPYRFWAADGALESFTCVR